MADLASHVSPAVEDPTEFGKDLGLVHETIVTARTLGLGRSFWAALAHNRVLLEMLGDVVAGRAEVLHNNHVIPTQDGSSLYLKVVGEATQERLRVHAHTPHAYLRWDPSHVVLKRVRDAMPDLTRALNATVALYLATHPYLIPADFFGKRLLFLGTRFSKDRSPRGHCMTLHCKTNPDGSGITDKYFTEIDDVDRDGPADTWVPFLRGHE